MTLRAAVLALLVAAGLAGCAGYRPAPLPDHADLAARLADLDRRIPAVAGRPAGTVDITEPLTIDAIGLLAILNNPGLKSEPGAVAVARAGVLRATLLPDPTADVTYGRLIAGPGTASSLAASLAQDIAALITRPARANAATAHLRAVNAEQLWREWQVAQKARQLAVDLYWGEEAIRLGERELNLISAEAAQVRDAMAKGNLTLAALAPLQTARAAAQQNLTGLQLAQLKNWQALDALVGLAPHVRFAIARPALPELPSDAAPPLADLPARRPDLAALRLGYLSAEEEVRAAILDQFPAFSIGPAYGSDTSNSVTVGPRFTFALPLFDRNQGNIAATQATRRLLREQYQARLDAAVAHVQALYAQLRRLEADLAAARQAAAAARSLAATARQAFAQGNLDQRSLTDYETTALERAVQVTMIERQIDEDRIFLAVELGLGLPRTHLALREGRP